MKKITKRVLLEEIQRINEIMKGSSNTNLNEQTIGFIEKLFRGGEEEITNVVKSIEKSGLRGADDVASAFRSLVEKGLTKLTEEESLFLANVIRQIYPDITYQVRRSLSDLLVAEIGPIKVGKLEDILANEKYPTDRLYNTLVNNFGMENLTILELQVWRDALKRTPSEIKIPTTVEVKPKPEKVIEPTELKLTPEQTQVVEEISQKVDNSLKNGTTDVLSGMPNINDVNQLESYYRQQLTSMGATPLEVEKMVLVWKNTLKQQSGNPELMRALDVLENTVNTLSKNNTPQKVEQIVTDKIENSPEVGKTWLRQWWYKRKNLPPSPARYLNIAMSVIQIGLLTFTAIKDDEDKYRGPFGMSTEQTFISKVAVLTLSLLTTNKLFTIPNVLLTWWDIKNAYSAADKLEPIKNDGSTSDSTSTKSKIDTVDLLKMISIIEAREYVESAENPLGIPMEDKITYTLYDSKGTQIQDETGKKKGIVVGVLVNGEAYTQLVKDPLTRKVIEKK